MTIERVTVSLPAELRQAAQKAADATGTAFSSVVADALLDWVRGRKIDELLAEYEAEAGEITEQEMRDMAKEMGLPHVEKRKARAA
jgi:hypothetical protein